MKRENTILLKLIYIAIFTALSFIGTMIFIPFGPSKIHLGNFICILAGLLCGGLIGGLSGSLGMGLNDIVMGYGPETYIRTFLLKFLMGFLVGTIFRLLLKKKANGLLFNLISTVLMLAVSVTMLVLYLGQMKNITLWIVILSFCLSLIFLLVTVFSRKLDPVLNILSFSLTVAIAVNVIGEFFIRAIINTIVGTTFDEAIAISLAKLPASLMTSLLTILLVLFLFYPVYKATSHLNAFNDLDDLIILKKGNKENGTK